MKQLCTFLVLLASACAYGQVGPIAITSAECATIGVGAKVSVITFQVTGTWTGTLQPKITVQGQAAANVQVTPSTSSTAASTVTANGIYTAQVNGADTFQVCGNTVASGTANVYLNTSVASKGGGGGSGGGSGTVTSVTFTGDGVVDSSTPSTAVTASGTVAATIKTQTAHTFLGNSTGSTAAPTFASLALADLPGTVVNATSPGAGICHFAGSTQTCTSSAIVAADITSGTITGTQIASSVALAGSPTTTTQAVGDSSTKVATTAFVAAATPNKTICSLTGSSDTRTTDGTFATTCTLGAIAAAGPRIIVDAVGVETFTNGVCSGSASTFGVDYDSTGILSAGNSDASFANAQSWSFHGEFILAVAGASGRINANPGYTVKQDGTAVKVDATAATVAYDSTASHVLKIHLTNSGTTCGPYVLTQFNVQQVF